MLIATPSVRQSYSGLYGGSLLYKTARRHISLSSLPLAWPTVCSPSASAGGLNLCDASRTETACRAWRRRQPDGTISLQI